MMSRIPAVIAVLLASVAVAPAAVAADVISYPTSTSQQVPVASDSTFDWNGFYAGVYGAYRHSPAAGDQFGVGIDAGVNVTFDYVLAGAEVAVEGLGGNDATSYISGVGRAGLLVTDNALVYGAAGYGIDTGPANESDALIGGGLEYAITNNLSVRGQYLHGIPVTGSNPKDEVTLGAQFHF
jgi:outer membrane immunogenic protein